MIIPCVIGKCITRSSMRMIASVACASGVSIAGVAISRFPSQPHGYRFKFVGAAPSRMIENHGADGPPTFLTVSSFFAKDRADHGLQRNEAMRHRALLFGGVGHIHPACRLMLRAHRQIRWIRVALFDPEGA